MLIRLHITFVKEHFWAQMPYVVQTCESFCHPQVTFTLPLNMQLMGIFWTS